MVLDDVIEYEYSSTGVRQVKKIFFDAIDYRMIASFSFVQTELDQILLNGSNVAILVPGGDPSEST